MTILIKDSKINKILFSYNKIEISRSFKAKDNCTLVLFEDGIANVDSVSTIRDVKQTSQPILRTLNKISFPDDSHLLSSVKVSLSDGKEFSGKILNLKKNQYFYQNQYEYANSTMVATNGSEFSKLVDLKQPYEKVSNGFKNSPNVTYINNIESTDRELNSMIEGNLFIDIFGEGEREIEVTYFIYQPVLNLVASKKLEIEDQSPNANNNASSLKDNSILKITQIVTFNPRLDFENVPVEFEIEKIRYEVPSLSCSRLTTSTVCLNSFTLQGRDGYISTFSTSSTPTLAPCILVENTTSYTIFSGAFNKLGLQNITPIKPGQLGILQFVQAPPVPGVEYQQQQRSKSFISSSSFSSSSSSNNKVSNSSSINQHIIKKNKKKNFFSKLLGKRQYSVPQPFEYLQTSHIDHIDSIKCSTSVTFIYTTQTEITSYRYTNLQNQDMEIVFSLTASDQKSIQPSEHLKKVTNDLVDQEQEEDEEEDSSETNLYKAIIQANSIFDFTINITSQNVSKYSYGPSEFCLQLIKPIKPTTSHQFETIDLSKRNLMPREAIDSMVNYNSKKSINLINTAIPTSTSSVGSSSTSSNNNNSSSGGSWFRK